MQEHLKNYDMIRTNFADWKKKYISLLDASEITLYRYLITFTIDPKKEITNYDEVENYIKSVSRRASLRIRTFHYIREKCKSGMPHWHAVIESEKRIYKNRFQYYEQLYGKVDLSLTKASCISDALNYISKDGKPTKLK